MLTKQIRSQLQRSPLVSVLFAGSVEHLMRDLFGPGRRALSQFGSFHELTPIGAGEWEAGISARYDELEVAVAEGAIEEIVALGEGHPRSTMLKWREPESSNAADAATGQCPSPCFGTILRRAPDLRRRQAGTAAGSPSSQRVP